jgi:hypothetical protein
MIGKSDLNILYHWAKECEFPMKTAPTVEGYSNKEISHCWIKAESVDKTGTKTVKYIRKKLIQDQKVIDIFDNSEILFATVSLFDPGTVLNKHKDPNVYRCPYKRIQIPLEIPDQEKCYMIWKDEKVFWAEGIPKVYEVMDYIHEGANLSGAPMKFLFLDVKKETIVDID